MTNTLHQTTLFTSNDFTMPEHRGGDHWTILHGDAMRIVPQFERNAFDAVITDPPYASGGAKPSEKNRTTTQKYSSMRADKALPDFDGDQKDQRSWTRWMAEWLSDVRKACKAGAVLCVFIDWRMAPCLSDAIQWAGWIWRGQVVWDKMTSRPQKGRYRQQSEYMLWASNGPCALPGFVDSKNEEKTERNAGYLVVSQSGGGMVRQGTRKGIRRTPANRGMRAHRVVKGLDISEDVCHGMCP